MKMNANRLAGESSMYLQSAAHQPVAWYPWGEEAFRAAKEKDRPVLLDIGAAWCHWCHVIDRESYEDPETARIINENFVAIKVDRDERPDIDSRYQAAVSAVSGQDGWPLTAFLTPDGEVFYGGTYFPPTDSFGRLSFKKVLFSVAEYYQREKGKIAQVTKSFFSNMSREEEIAQSLEKTEEGYILEALDGVRNQYDVVNGGFGNAPKFPHPGAIEFLLATYYRRGDYWMKEAAVGTLSAMAHGGIHDHIGGGFHRYSTDAHWIVPHFEKMLCDNAWLLQNYVHAYQILGDPLFRATALDVLQWTFEVMTDRETGAFYGSQDADVGLEDDGDYFTWTLGEANEVLSDDELRVLSMHFDLGERGEMHHNPEKNVLFVDKSETEIAKALGLNESRVREIIDAGKLKMRGARERRPPPKTDHVIYASWNGMMIAAIAEAYKAFHDSVLLERMVRSLDFLKRRMFESGKGISHSFSRGTAKIAGFLDDNVEVLNAALGVFEVTQNRRYLDWSIQLAGFIGENFWDDQAGGLFDTSRRHAPQETPSLAIPRKPVEDSPSPSANGVAALAFLKLYHLTWNESYRRTFESIIRGLLPQAQRMGGVFAGTYFLGLELFLHPPASIVIIPGGDEHAHQQLLDVAFSVFSPGKTVLLVNDAHANLPDFLDSMVSRVRADDSAIAFVCRGTTCLPPVSDPRKLAEILRSASSPL